MYVVEHRIVSRGRLRDWTVSAEYLGRDDAHSYLANSERMFPEIEWRIVYKEIK